MEFEKIVDNLRKRPIFDRFRRRPSTTEKVGRVAEDAATEIRTNPGVPVAGALGLTMLGAAIARRVRHRKPPFATGEAG